MAAGQVNPSTVECALVFHMMFERAGLSQQSAWNVLEFEYSKPRSYITTSSTQTEDFRSVVVTVRGAFASVFGDKIKYRTLLNSQGDAAQNVLDLLQMLLDYPQSDAVLRSSLLTTLLRLSKRTLLYPRCFSLKDIERRDGPITAGHFGEIWKGQFQGKPVCLKIVKVYERSRVERLLKAFWKEALLWAHISHINVLPFYGVFHLEDPYRRICLVSPWMENGNINEYLRQHPDTTRLLLISDIIDGITYLHSEYIIHGDLKGANILVTASGRACLADFGLSNVMDGETLKWTSLDSSSNRGGTLRWLAPELMLPEGIHDVRNSKASDMYAFSCVCYEVFTGLNPFHELSYDAAVLFRVVSGERPSRPAQNSPPCRDWGLTDPMWRLMSHCWKADPLDRPHASEVKERLPFGNIVDNRVKDEQNMLTPAHFRNAMHGASGRFTEEHLRHIISQTNSPLHLLLGLSDSTKKSRKSSAYGRRPGGPRPPISPTQSPSNGPVAEVPRQCMEVVHESRKREIIERMPRPRLVIDCRPRPGETSSSDRTVIEHHRSSSIGYIPFTSVPKDKEKDTISYTPTVDVEPSNITTKANVYSSPESPRKISHSSTGPTGKIEYLLGKTVDNSTNCRVYLALNTVTRELMAAKFPRTGARDKSYTRRRSSTDKLRSEIDILKTIDHPNIVQYLASSETTLFLEYVSGGSIRSCVRHYGRLQDDVTKSFTTQILSGLAYLHSRGIIHRNLRSDNILLESSGSCKICGFGNAKRTEDGVASTYLPSKAQWWMAPEAIAGDEDAAYDVKIDIWSLGCVVMEMWTGSRPWKGQFIESNSLPSIPENLLSALADDFRQNCFVINPCNRPGAKDLIKHPYLILPPSWAFTGFT